MFDPLFREVPKEVEQHEIRTPRQHGRLPPREPRADERLVADEAVVRAAQGIKVWSSDGITSAMNQFN